MIKQSDIDAKELNMAFVCAIFLGLGWAYCVYLKRERDRMINKAYGMDLNFQPLAC